MLIWYVLTKLYHSSDTVYNKGKCSHQFDLTKVHGQTMVIILFHGDVHTQLCVYLGWSELLQEVLQQAARRSP